ncbi:hypothetical protein HanXRQr2_Chr10g0442001 [Helianthus annuus]|uniref:Plasminogen activator inhibitor n=1 Tax=Helianthus annuus TaxID=4232 RepID=A0A251TK77_HELAN|nr:uncharacterized protein LOC110885469 [Helianthus annuus]KAF5786528.1 hypothetical protein HanXRQr2_Chr10g0442001 [Helianthus annuus]KAJ0530049.1 hypothetical protein HanHA89_Chr10g0385151 [Helianthus annuus]KAJ0696907.1 hypothetical protein HanLR1_Chr10g0362691 [Helianthus annuus]
MPLTSVLADALGVVTICLVAVLGLIGLLCILYSFYFRDHIRSQSQTQLRYFSGPWVVRIIFILFAIWWGFGEILRLEFLRRDGRVLNTLDLKWQETVCKCYIVSNLGFSEPCLFLTLIFLLRASLQKTESGPLSLKWNFRTVMYILLCALPLFALQMTVVLVGPNFETDLHMNKKGYFFKTTEDLNNVARCYYPLLSTMFLGLFATILTLYLFWLGSRILFLVINKGLKKRVYTLIFFVSGFYPLRVLLLGLSVLFTPGDAVFEVVAFLAFLSLLCCVGVGICVLVYFPIADSLALKNLQDMEATRRIIGEHNDTLSLIANHVPLDDFTASSGRNSSTKCGSISFRAMEPDEQHVDQHRFVELSLFSPSQHSTPAGSPQLHGWPTTVPSRSEQ